jgi:hypothetical protein
MVSRHNRFNNSVTLKLKYIEKNRNQTENFMRQIVGKIKITNEPIYKDFEYPDEEYIIRTI